MTPPQTLRREDLVKAAPLDRDASLLVEVSLQAVERPAGQGQTQALGIGQSGGDDFGALLGGGGVGSARVRAIIEAGQPPLVEAMDPGGDRLPADVDLRGDSAGALSVGGDQKDLGALEETGWCSPRLSQLLEGVTLPGRQGAERDLVGSRHGCTSTREYILSTRDCR
jgi:hypothetical protein